MKVHIEKLEEIKSKLGQPYLKISTDLGMVFVWDSKLFPSFNEGGWVEIETEDKKGYLTVMKAAQLKEEAAEQLPKPVLIQRGDTRDRLIARQVAWKVAAQLCSWEAENSTQHILFSVAQETVRKIENDIMEVSV